jgi:hypothetical protein
MIDALRSTLARRAAEVVARPDPYVRVLRRSRRRRLRRISATVVAAVLLVTVPSALLIGYREPYMPVAGPPPAKLLPLLDSPTRGNLAGDAAFLAALRERAAAEVDAGRGRPARGPQMPDDPHMIKVLFAGDIGSRRVAVVAGLDGWPLSATFQGKVGDTADDLEISSSGELQPVVDGGFASSGLDPAQTYLLLGPTGAVYEQATTTYTAAGVRRSWSRATDAADYLAVADLKGRHEFRVLLEGKVLLETTAAPNEVGRKVTVDPRPVGDRGRPLPSAAQQIATILSHLTGLSEPDATFRVLWSDEFDMPGAAKGKANVVTVQAVTADGGGPFLTGAVDTDGIFRDHPTGYGIAGGPENTLIAMRLPTYVAEVSDRLQLIAPTTALRAEVASATQTWQVPLVNGVGHLDLPPGTAVTVRAYDAGDISLATKRYLDLDGFGCNHFDAFICSSPPPTRASRPTR